MKPPYSEEELYRKNRNKGCLAIMLTLSPIIGAIAFLLGLWWGMSYMEAKAYNRATDSNVSTWDAMWISLRVQGTPINK